METNQNFYPYLLTFFRMFIVFVFLFSALLKLRDVQRFTRTIENFRVIPRRFSAIAANAVIFAEIATAGLLLFGARMIGFSSAALLLSAFTALLVSVLVRGISTDCNCFGSSKRHVRWSDVVRNGGFVLSAIVGLLLTMSGVATGTVALLEWLALTVTAAFIAVIWSQMGDILDLLRRSA